MESELIKQNQGLANKNNKKMKKKQNTEKKF